MGQNILVLAVAVLMGLSLYRLCENYTMLNNGWILWIVQSVLCCLCIGISSLLCFYILIPEFRSFGKRVVNKKL